MSRRTKRGQILVLFVLALVAILAMLALLFDGAFAYVQRRSLQDAGDAAALAGANGITDVGGTCSASGFSTPGAPRPQVVAAVMASLADNLPGFDPANVTVTCPTGISNAGVKVTLHRDGANFLSAAIGAGELDVTTASTAVNGRISPGDFSIVLLNPWKPTWPNGSRGCPSLLFSGGPTAIFEGAVQIDSACPSSNVGAIGTNGGAATVTLNAGEIRMVGSWQQGSLTINPPPLTGQPYFSDPLIDLAPPSIGSLPVRRTSKLILSNETRILQPGVYRGGIELRNSSIALLRPGIYYFDGGGLDVGAQASICSINATANPTSCSGWETLCGNTDCGVLLYNAGTASGSGAMTPISVAAGSTVKLRAYDEQASAGFDRFHNLVLFQSRTPAASASYRQPTVWLNGGGNMDVSGTIYAPEALVHLGGTSGGAGGGAVNLTVQFIVWDFEIQGNASFHFFYGSDAFVQPLEYGLYQ